MSTLYITAADVAELLGISKSKSYKIISKLNAELAEKGYITVAGKCSKKYFQEKFYGFEVE